MNANNLHEQRLMDENSRLRAALLKFVDHFGPLEDNYMVHEDARKCFKLARAALGPETHDAAIKAVLNN
tara:strand:- start:3886 stop:4092 length:207 start_codon:yes stop_codon:yes gene_type:complete